LEGPYIVRFSGECDVSRYPELRAALEAVPVAARRIVVDFSEVTAVDSTCLTELLFAKRRWDREGRTTATIVADENVYRIMLLADVVERLRVFRDPDEARRCVFASA
jgi:anti-anti-sigma regulatory factor